MRSGLILGFVTLGAMLFSHSASALSCARPNLVDVLEEVKASPKLYYILRGNFDSRPHATAQERVTQTHFRGVSLAPGRGADRHLTRFPVKVETSCAGPWCASAPPPKRSVIAFVEASTRGWSGLLNIGPCPQYVFDATPENIQTVRSCLKSTCASAPAVSR